MKINNYAVNELTYNDTSYETNTSFFKDNENQNVKYKNAIESIKNFLKKIIPDYGLSELNVNKDIKTGFKTSFEIKVPKDISIDDLIKYSDEIFNRIFEFIELHDIKFILDEFTITLTRN